MVLCTACSRLIMECSWLEIKDKLQPLNRQGWKLPWFVPAPPSLSYPCNICPAANQCHPINWWNTLWHYAAEFVALTPSNSFLVGGQTMQCNARCTFVISFLGSLQCSHLVTKVLSLPTSSVAWWWGMLDCELNDEEKACGADEVMKVLRRVFAGMRPRPVSFEWGGRPWAAVPYHPLHLHHLPPRESKTVDINILLTFKVIPLPYFCHHLLLIPSFRFL